MSENDEFEESERPIVRRTRTYQNPKAPPAITGPDEYDWPQFKTTAILKANKVGGEILTFTIRLGFFQIICIVNIPSEDQTESPVYCKCKVVKPRDEYAPRDDRGWKQKVLHVSRAGESLPGSRVSDVWASSPGSWLMSEITEIFKALSFREKKRTFKELRKIYSDELFWEKDKAKNRRQKALIETSEFVKSLIPGLEKIGVVYKVWRTIPKVTTTMHYASFTFQQQQIYLWLNEQSILIKFADGKTSIKKTLSPEKVIKKIQDLLNLQMTSQVIDSWLVMFGKRDVFPRSCMNGFVPDVLYIYLNIINTKKLMLNRGTQILSLKVIQYQIATLH